MVQETLQYEGIYVVGRLIPLGQVELRDFQVLEEARAFYRKQIPLAAKIFFEKTTCFEENNVWFEREKYGLPEPVRQIRRKFDEYRQKRELLEAFMSNMHGMDMSRQLFPSSEEREVARALFPGEQVMFDCSFLGKPFTHHAIYVGQFKLEVEGDKLQIDSSLPHRVVEVERDGASAKIVMSSLQDFVARADRNGGGSNLPRVRYYFNRTHTRLETIKIALGKVGDKFVFTGFRNCEAFAFFCVMMKSRSFQADEAFKVLCRFNKTAARYASFVSTTCMCYRALTVTGKAGKALTGGAKIMRALKVAGNGVKATRGIQNIVSGVGGFGGTVLAEQTLGDGTDEQNVAIQVGGTLGGLAGGIGSTSLIAACAAEGTFGGAVVTSGLAGLGGSMLGGLAVCTGIGAVAAFGGAALAIKAKNMVFSDNNKSSRGTGGNDEAANFCLDFDLLFLADPIRVFIYGDVIAFFLPFDRQQPLCSRKSRQQSSPDDMELSVENLCRAFHALTLEENDV